MKEKLKKILIHLLCYALTSVSCMAIFWLVLWGIDGFSNLAGDFISILLASVLFTATWSAIPYLVAILIIKFKNFTSIRTYALFGTLIPISILSFFMIGESLKGLTFAWELMPIFLLGAIGGAIYYKLERYFTKLLLNP